jgi:hypothetical protein
VRVSAAGLAPSPPFHDLHLGRRGRRLLHAAPCIALCGIEILWWPLESLFAWDGGWHPINRSLPYTLHAPQLVTSTPAAGPVALSFRR